MQSHALELDGLGALLTTRWAAYRRGFDSRWQPRVVPASKHTCDNIGGGHGIYRWDRATRTQRSSTGGARASQARRETRRIHRGAQR